MSINLSCHSEPVTDVTGVGIRSPFHANRRPKAATYLCRFAAKARFDNRPNPRRVFPKREGRSPPSLVVSRLGDFQGGREIEIPSPLNGVLWILSFAKERKYPAGGIPRRGAELPCLSGKKVTRRRQQKKNPKAARCSHRAAHDQILYSSASFQPSTSAAAIRRPRRGRSNSPS